MCPEIIYHEPRRHLPSWVRSFYEWPLVFRMYLFLPSTGSLLSKQTLGILKVRVALNPPACLHANRSLAHPQTKTYTTHSANNARY